MRLARNARAYERFERAMEFPMLVAASLIALALIVPLFADLPAFIADGLETGLWVLWALFVFEYVTLLILAPDRGHMVRTHVLDLVLIAVPFLRPLRLLRVVATVSSLARSGQALSLLTGRTGVRWYLGIATFVIVAGGIVYAAVEHDTPGVDNVGDGLWWALVTTTTVGYGDQVPITGEGRAVAALLMLLGISLISVVTASVATFLVQTDDQGIEQVNERLARVEDLLGDDALRRYRELPIAARAEVDALVTRLHPGTDGHRTTSDPHPEHVPEHAT